MKSLNLIHIDTLENNIYTLNNKLMVKDTSISVLKMN